eukprot:3597263-Rhodomonas_salina.2
MIPPAGWNSDSGLAALIMIMMIIGNTTAQADWPGHKPTRTTASESQQPMQPQLEVPAQLVQEDVGSTSSLLASMQPRPIPERPRAQHNRLLVRPT